MRQPSCCLKRCAASGPAGRSGASSLRPGRAPAGGQPAPLAPRVPAGPPAAHSVHIILKLFDAGSAASQCSAVSQSVSPISSLCAHHLSIPCAGTRACTAQHSAATQRTTQRAAHNAARSTQHAAHHVCFWQTGNAAWHVAGCSLLPCPAHLTGLLKANQAHRRVQQQRPCEPLLQPHAPP